MEIIVRPRKEVTKRNLLRFEPPPGVSPDASIFAGEYPLL
jgi:hypothetical protein